jgi:hypothetical protein
MRKLMCGPGGEQTGRRSSAAERGRAMSRAIRGGACVLPAMAAMLALGACGGSTLSHSTLSSSTSNPSAAASARDKIARSGVQAGRGVTPIAKFPGADQVRPTRRGPVKARAQAGAIDDEVSTSGAKTLDPCSLVSRAQAQAILGRPVGRPVDAPQGHTCVYTPEDAGSPFKNPITLAVVATNFSTLKPQAQLRDRMSVTVSGHAAYCGVAGVPTMIVPLSVGRFLTVTAPCPIAATFAAEALRHIKT